MKAGQKEGLLPHTEIFSSEYKSESKTSIGSILPEYTSFPPTPPLLWDALDMNNFYFLFLLFSDFIGIFVFVFVFFWRMKRHVTL